MKTSTIFKYRLPVIYFSTYVLCNQVPTSITVKAIFSVFSLPQFRKPYQNLSLNCLNMGAAYLSSSTLDFTRMHINELSCKADLPMMHHPNHIEKKSSIFSYFFVTFVVFSTQIDSDRFQETFTGDIYFFTLQFFYEILGFFYYF